MTPSATFEVPLAVRETALEALSLQKKQPLDDVYGVALAERIVAGTVTVEDVQAMHRFFAVNDDRYRSSVLEARTARNSALCRSWMLRGAEHGRVWTDRIFKRLVAEGTISEDPYDALLRVEPDEIYARFKAGAWRWEYGLDTVSKAARFYEDYHRATRKVLDLHRAFGESGRAVANAIHRRVHGPDPFREAVKALANADSEAVRRAAALDREDLQSSLLHGLSESAHGLTDKMVWPSFIAYLIVARERPSLLENYPHGARPPAPTERPRALCEYDDVTNLYVAYFHPEGSRFCDPAGTKYDSVGRDLHELLARAYYRRRLPQLVEIYQPMTQARSWTCENHLAGSLFHLYFVDWERRDWSRLLETIPHDADVRPVFEAFVAAESALPAG